jgi:hypothetical protein
MHVDLALTLFDRYRREVCQRQGRAFYFRFSDFELNHTSSGNTRRFPFAISTLLPNFKVRFGESGTSGMGHPREPLIPLPHDT